MTISLINLLFQDIYPLNMSFINQIMPYLSSVILSYASSYQFHIIILWEMWVFGQRKHANLSLRGVVNVFNNFKWNNNQLQPYSEIKK